MSNDTLQSEHAAVHAKAAKLAASLASELTQLVAQEHIPLAVPIEFRVKTWASIAEKMERKELEITSITDLQDLIGLRFILLYRRHIDSVHLILDKTLSILSREDTGQRLGEDQFGYQSVHYVVALRPEWLTVPSFAGCDDLHIEIQIRTLAQHMWAAVSHQLQYKTPGAVPQPVRRSINRVSAMLETVDLEFERVLAERENYIAHASRTPEDETELNADTLAQFLLSALPPENASPAEQIATLLPGLQRAEISTVRDLRLLCDRQLKTVLQQDARIVAHVKAGNKPIREKVGNQEVTKTYGANPDRIARGGFYTHVGLVRAMLDRERGT